MTPVTREFLEDVRYMYVECLMTPAEIGAALGLTESAISHHVKRLGIRRQRGQRRYKTLVEMRNAAEKMKELRQ